MVGANGKKIFDFDNPRSADIEIVGWCPAVPVLPPWREGVSLAVLDHPYHNKNTLWCRCFIISTNFAPHLFLLGWLKRNLVLLLDQLRPT